VLLDAAPATRNLGRLVVGRDDWAEGLDASTGGFLRSFAGPLMALPFALAADAALSQAAQPAAPRAAAALWVTGAGHLIDTVLYPLLVAAMVWRLGGKGGYGAFVVLINWMGFWLNLTLAATGLVVMAGAPAAVVQVGGFALFAGSLYLTWRAARETLTGEIGFSLAVVMLAFASELGSYVAAAALVKVFG